MKIVIIGEKLNSSIRQVREAVERGDSDFIAQLALAQEKAGAHFIDVNAGMFGDAEPEKLLWMVKTVTAVTGLPLSVDSASPKAIAAALEGYNGPKPIINSITLESDRFAPMLELAVQYNTGLIALCMDDRGMPESTAQRLEIAVQLTEQLTAAGLRPQDIYIDPMVQPVATDSESGPQALETIAFIRKQLPQVNIVCGLSNISYGMPARANINRAFLIAAMTSGLNSAIMDPLDKRLMSLYFAAKAVLGQDEYCEEYLDQYRDGRFDD